MVDLCTALNLSMEQSNTLDISNDVGGQYTPLNKDDGSSAGGLSKTNTNGIYEIQDHMITT